MKILGFLSHFSFLSLCFSSLGLMAQTIDSTEIDPNPIEHGREVKDRSILNLKTGTFKFGDSSIELENFHSVKLEKGWYKKISFRSDLLLLARIETSRGGNGGDTLWLKQSKNIALKKALSRYNVKKNRTNIVSVPATIRVWEAIALRDNAIIFFWLTPKKENGLK